MYRRYLGQDEQLSQVLVFFVSSLVFGFLISWKLVGVDTFDAEMIVYLVFGGISFLLFVLMSVLFLIGKKRPFLDVELNLKDQTITFFYGLITIPLEQVKLASFNRRHRQVRLVVRWYNVGFPIDEVTDKKGNPLSEDQLESIAPNALVVEPKVMYNYPMFVTGVLEVLFVAYIVFYGRNQTPLFGWRYIETYYILALLIILSGIAFGLNYWRLSKIIQHAEGLTDTTE